MKKKNSKNITIVAEYETDLGLIIQWLRLNKAISSAGSITKRGSTYAVRVKGKISKQGVSNLVKDRFGVFARVI